jgi:hypothetical protein
MNADARIKLSAPPGPQECTAHKPLVDVLLSFDKRLARLEWMVGLAAAAALGTFGKAVLLPMLTKIAGG